MASKDMSIRIKELRQERGLTLEQVAKVVGVGKSTVRKWETGMIANMKRDKIASLAKALGTTTAYLMGWQEVMEDKRMDSGHRELVALIEQLTDEEVAELSNFVDYIISKRK